MCLETVLRHFEITLNPTFLKRRNEGSVVGLYEWLPLLGESISWPHKPSPRDAFIKCQLKLGRGQGKPSPWSFCVN